jgi:hypothetical protein
MGPILIHVLGLLRSGHYWQIYQLVYRKKNLYTRPLDRYQHTASHK